MSAFDVSRPTSAIAGVDDLATLIVAKTVASQPQPVASSSGANPDAHVPFIFGRRIAQGGMGAILEAEDCKFGRKIAVKVMRLDSGASEEQRQRFIQEAAVLGRLEHPNIVPVHDLGRDSAGELYYTMKLVKGRTLQDILDDLRHEKPEALQHYTLDRLLMIFRKVCDALAFAHAQNIIHRDLKPENIMVGEFGEVLVMDWGISKILGELGKEELPAAASVRPTTLTGTISASATMDGAVMGTPNYMSPEQALGKVNELDERSDIFSLGGILYCILTLRPPVDGKDVWEVLEKVSSASITPPTSFGTTTSKDKAAVKGAVLEAKKVKPLPHVPAGRVPPSLSAVAMKALTLDKMKRYQNVEAFCADLEKYQGGFVTSAERAGAWKQFSLMVKRHKAASTGLAAVLIVGSAFGTQAVLEGRRAERALTELKKSAPAMLQFAENEAGFQRFDSALDKVDAALLLDPSLLSGWWRRAWLLLAQDRITESADAVLEARQRDPTHAGKLGAILPLLETLHTTPAAERWNPERSKAVLDYLNAVGASGEAIALSNRFQLSGKDKVKLVQARLAEWLGPIIKGAKDGLAKGNVTIAHDGTLAVSTFPKTLDSLEPLRGLPINQLTLGQTMVSDLKPLHEMPLHTLVLTGCTRLTDLTPLHGMQLRDLNINGTLIADLTPLAGQPLEQLDLSGTLVEDLHPLQGMPLDTLYLDKTKVHDLSPLVGMPLRFLDLTGTNVGDLSPLKGMPLEQLRGGGKGVNLEPLRGAPLKRVDVSSEDYSPLIGIELESLIIGRVTDRALKSMAGIRTQSLHVTLAAIKAKAAQSLEFFKQVQFKSLFLAGAVNVQDLSPLRECLGMEELTLLNCNASLEPLRGHPTLKRLSFYRTGERQAPLLPVAKFWQAYDAQQADGKK